MYAIRSYYANHFFPNCLLAGVLFFCLVQVNGQSKIPSPFELNVSEGFVNPIGFYDNKPSFSWKLPVSEQVKFQLAYRIVVASDSTFLPDKADFVITSYSIHYTKLYELRNGVGKFTGLPVVFSHG